MLLHIPFVILFCSLSRTFFRLGIAQSSLALLIWLTFFITSAKLVHFIHIQARNCPKLSFYPLSVDIRQHFDLHQ